MCIRASITALKAAFDIGTHTGREGAAPQTVLGVNIGSKSYSSGEISSADAAGLQQASLRAIMTALQASELPKYLAGVFDDITATTATTDQITASLAGAQALATVSYTHLRAENRRWLCLGTGLGFKNHA